MAVEGYRDEIGKNLVPWQTRRGLQLAHQACGFEMLYQESKNRSDASSISSGATV